MYGGGDLWTVAVIRGGSSGLGSNASSCCCPKSSIFICCWWCFCCSDSIPIFLCLPVDDIWILSMKSLSLSHSQFLKLLCSAQIARMLHYTIVLSSDKNNLFVHQSQNNIDRNDRVRAHTYKWMGSTIKSRKVGTKFAFDPISIHLNTHTSTPGTVRSSEKKRTFNCECITVNFSIQFKLMCWAQFFASNFDVFSLFFDSLSTKCRNHFKMIADFLLFCSDFVYKIENFDHKMY